MHTPQPQAQRLMAALGQHLNTQLSLDEGVCALFDAQGKEAAVIEIPAHSDTAILHCAIEMPLHSATAHKQLLELNFRIDTLRGCWLALDERGEVRLCAQSPLDSLSEERFCHWVVGFIAQVKDTRELLSRQRPATGAPTQRSSLGSNPMAAALR
ncbi:type III secretion system chaperone [Pseudomonas borbori]